MRPHQLLSLCRRHECGGVCTIFLHSVPLSIQTLKVEPYHDSFLARYLIQRALRVSHAGS